MKKNPTKKPTKKTYKPRTEAQKIARRERDRARAAAKRAAKANAPAPVKKAAPVKNAPAKSVAKKAAPDKKRDVESSTSELAAFKAFMRATNEFKAVNKTCDLIGHALLELIRVFNPSIVGIKFSVDDKKNANAKKAAKK